MIKKGIKAQETLGLIFAQKAVQVTVSVSDEAVAAFKDLAQTRDPQAIRDFFSATTTRQRQGPYFIASYLQDQRRPERFDTVVNFLLSHSDDYVCAGDGYDNDYVLFQALEYAGYAATEEMFVPLRQSPAHLARIFKESDIVRDCRNTSAHVAPDLWEDVVSLTPHPHYLAAALSRWRTMRVFLDSTIAQDLVTKMTTLGESHPELLAGVLSAENVMGEFGHKAIEKFLITIRNHPTLLNPLIDQYQDLALWRSRQKLANLEVDGIVGKYEGRIQELRDYIAAFEGRINALRPTTTGNVAIAPTL